jgi:hypothetical protein
MSRPNQSGIRRKILVTIAALGLLAMLAVCYYYYFSRKEQRMEERNFRVLHRVEENFGRRLQDYRQRFISAIKVCGNPNGKIDSTQLACIKKTLEGDEKIEVDTISTLPKVSWEFDQSEQLNVISFYFSNQEVFANGRKQPYFKFTVPSQSVLESVLRYDVFPSYHLRALSGPAYNNCPEVCDLVHPDSLSKTDHVQILKIGTGRYYVFSHPFSLPGAHGVVLSGLISGERYGQEKFNVPGNFLLGVFLLLLITLLSFPFIKSFLVSPEETLRVPDILMALLSLFLLCYMFTFIHLSIFSSTRDDHAKEQMLEQTSSSLSTSFLADIDRMREQLRAFDNVYWDHFDSLGRSINADTLVKIPAATICPDFFRAFWLNKDGSQVKTIDRSHNTYFSETRSYKDRDYFKAVSQNQLWYPDSAESKKFYLEPVYSRTDGTFRAVLSMKSSRGPLFPTISSDLRSVIDPVLPREVDFCLLDARGNILFTSTGVEHLRENFQEECDFSTGVTDALNSRSRKFMNQSFMGRDCKILIKPLNGLPLHLVTLTYNEYSGNTLLQVCIYTSLFILAILVVFSTVVFLLIFLTRKSSNPLVHKPYLDISLVFPASRYLYSDFAGILSNLMLMIAVCIAGYISRDHPCTLVALLLLCASGTTATFCFARLDTEPSRIRVFWMLTILCFVFIDLLLLQIDQSQNISSIVCMVLFECLLIIDTIILRKVHLYEVRMLDDESLVNSDHSASGSRIVASLIRFQHWFRDGFERLTDHKLRFYNQFAFMLVTWFFLATVISSVFMFRYVYRNELEYRIRSAQIDIARKLYEHKPYNRAINSMNPGSSQLPDVQTYVGGYFSTQLSANKSSIPRTQNQEQIFDRLLEAYRLSWNKGANSRGSDATPAADSSIDFGRDDGVLLLSYQNLLDRTEDSTDNHVQISSKMPGFPFPRLQGGNLIRFVWFYLAQFAFLILFFYAINFFLKRFFLFTLLPHERKDDSELFEQFYKKYHDSPLKLIILGVTASGKRELVQNLAEYINEREKAKRGKEGESGSVNTEDLQLHFLDLAELKESLEAIPNVVVKNGDIVMLNHFEHNLSEKETNDKKFEIISTLSSVCEKVQAHLVILSNIHPSVFLKNQKAKAESGSFDAEDYINTQDYYNWTGLLSGFQIYVKHYPERPANKFDTHEESTDLYNKTKSWYLYYLSIWNSLERIEKFVAYDLATDGLVNYRNQAALYSLYSKGLVVMKDVPELMTEEFRTFILTEVSESDVELEKRQGGHRSAWDLFRIPFLVVVFGALMFVFLTQQETFNKLMAGLAAVAGSVPLLIRLFTQEKKPS